MTEEIKPCPFCGSKDKEYVQVLKTRGRELYYVMCYSCSARSGERPYKERAIQIWNQRPYDYDMPAIVKKVQQLEKALVRCGRAINYACEYYLDFSAGAEVLAYINGYDDQEDLEPLLRQLEEKSCKQPE